MKLLLPLLFSALIFMGCGDTTTPQEGRGGGGGGKWTGAGGAGPGFDGSGEGQGEHGTIPATTNELAQPTNSSPPAL